MATKTKKETTILDRISDYLKRFISFTNEEDSLIISLWILHTWTFMESFPRTPWVTPYIYIWSDTPGAGKTRLMDIVETLVYNPEKAGDLTSAAMFTLIEQSHPTLLVDEVDTVFKSGGAGNEALRRTLNTGYTHSGYAVRKVGREVEKYSTFAPKLLAGINSLNAELPETVRTRSIPLMLVRRNPPEVYYSFLHGPEAEAISEEIDAWIRNNGQALIEYMPEPIASMEPRAFEISMPLLQIAHVLKMEAEARTALIQMLAPPPPKDQPEIAMLRKVREVFDSTGQSKLFTAELTDALGDGWTGHLLANRLRLFGVGTPVNMTIHGRRGRGYLRSMLAEAWDKYL